MLSLLRFSSSKFLLNIFSWNLSYLFSKFELHSFGEELIKEKGNFWNTKFDLRKIEKEGREISVNFVSKGEASTFARAFELNFFTKAHLHVKGKTRVKGSFFLPLEYLTNSKDRLKFVEWRICIEVYPFVPSYELLRDFSLNFFFFFIDDRKSRHASNFTKGIYLYLWWVYVWIYRIVTSIIASKVTSRYENSNKSNVLIFRDTSRDGCSRVTR